LIITFGIWKKYPTTVKSMCGIADISPSRISHDIALRQKGKLLALDYFFGIWSS